MFKLLLKFLLYLSKKNESIKRDIFEKLTQILEFSEYIYINDKSDLLNFIFEILDDSETLQDLILSKKYKPTKSLFNEDIEGILYIDKILSYIETSCNYLYYYKKLMHLNKIRYREKDIKQKIEIHIQKVNNDFRMNKYVNNYKGKIFSSIKNITNLVNGQIKEWEKYTEDKDKKAFKEEEKSGDDKGFDTEENYNMNKIIKRERQNDTMEMGSIKGSKQIKKTNYKDDYDSSNKLEEDKNDLNSNDFLNGRSLFNPNKRAKSFFNTPNKTNNLNDPNNSENNSKNLEINLTKNINEKILESDEVINNYNNNNKKADNELVKLARNKIQILNKVLDFLDYFNTINFDKILFRKEELFMNMLKSDIKDDILENNLNFIINGNVCFIKFITDLDFSTETTIGSIIPYYIYNTFFANDSERHSNNKEAENDNDSYNANIEIIGSENGENILEDHNGINNKKESSEEEEEEDLENDEEYDLDEDNGNIGNYISKNEIKEGKQLNFDNENDNDNDNDKDNDKENINKKESIFLRQHTKEDKKKRRLTSSIGFSFFKKSDKNLIEEEKDKDPKNKVHFNINQINEDEVENEDSTLRKRKKHATIYQKRDNYENSVKNLLKEEAKKNELMRFLEKCKEENEKINKYLYILYYIYIFCANEYIEINYKFYKSLINYFINYDRFCKLHFLKLSLDDIKKNILNKIVFINKSSFLNKIFIKLKTNPTLLLDNFDLENFIDLNENLFDEYDKENEEKNMYNRKRDMTVKNKNVIKKDSLFSKLKKLSNEEVIIVDFLIYFCKINDQINYLIEKIECFKNIQKLICNPQNQIITKSKTDIKTKNKEEPKNIFEEEIKKVMRQLISNKFNILSLYEKLYLTKNKFINSNKNPQRSNLLEDYGIFKQADFMLWLLEQYEIDRYFNKIIYLEINQNVTQDKNSFDKLMNIKELFQIIESEIHKAKDENEKTKVKGKVKESENHYRIICNKLMSMTKKVLLNIFSGKKMKEEKIIQMLIKENENFFAKIGFLNTLKIMIESIELYDMQYNIENEAKNENNYICKLDYCKEVLRAI